MRRRDWLAMVSGSGERCGAGIIGGYSSFIGFDKQNGNAIVVLQNAFNWSNYLGIALLTDLAKRR
ncbi:hypothetical protein B6N31_21120 [Dickeya fangzhongdai]|nr:hypothetical protein B6N31_21120 [Dickeya fangzhongdai]GGC06891.1 hypothetical protein GCM10007171_24870 [Dickeya fangzhongdai]